MFCSCRSDQPPTYWKTGRPLCVNVLAQIPPLHHNQKYDGESIALKASKKQMKKH